MIKEIDTPAHLIFKCEYLCVKLTRRLQNIDFTNWLFHSNVTVRYICTKRPPYSPGRMRTMPRIAEKRKEDNLSFLRSTSLVASSILSKIARHNMADEARNMTLNVLLRARDQRWNWRGHILRMGERRKVR